MSNDFFIEEYEQEIIDESDRRIHLEIPNYYEEIVTKEKIEEQEPKRVIIIDL
jgi:hypothetical protein